MVNFGISGTALTWFSSYLTDRFQSVLIDGNYPSDFNLMYGVPQCYHKFTMYMLPLGKILKSHNVDYHVYADDTHLYTSAHPDNLSSLLLIIQNCCDYVGMWRHENKLKLNNDKTEVLLCSTESKQSKVHISDITLGGTTIAISDKSKHLWVILDNTFSMEHQINAVVKAMYFEIRNISRMKSIKSYDSVKTLVTSMVLSGLDYCNSLLA